MLVMVTFRHSPESCPMHNEKAKKAYVNANAKIRQLTKKHGIKLVGAWATTEHSEVLIYEAPSMEAFMEFAMEPESVSLGAYVTPEIQQVITFEEFIKLIK
jgi:hypothetical protein